MRVLAGDFGCALFALANLIRGRGVQLHVAAYRAGTEPRTSSCRAADNLTPPFVDSGVVFLVGPVSKVQLLLPIWPGLPEAARCTNSLGMGSFIRGWPGETSGATATASIETLLKYDSKLGWKTARWPMLPECRQKALRTFKHTGNTSDTVLVPQMIFFKAQRRRNARAAQRMGKDKGKGKDKAKGKPKPVDVDDL